MPLVNFLGALFVELLNLVFPNPPLPPPAHSPRDSRLHLPSPRSSPRGFPMGNGDYLPVSNSVSQGTHFCPQKIGKKNRQNLLTL